MIVLNDVSDPEIGFESERTRSRWSRRGPSRSVAIDSKEAIAEAILDRVDGAARAPARHSSSA